jgi:hypothetical protein
MSGQRDTGSGATGMKNLIIASIAINILLVFCTFDDLLSLHDIRADYVSKSVLSYLHVETSATLPTWTDTRLEWASITISYVVRSIVIVSNLAILHFLRKRLPCRNALALMQK